MIKYDKIECGIILGIMLIMVIGLTGCKKKDEFDTNPEYVLIESVDTLS